MGTGGGGVEVSDTVKLALGQEEDYLLKLAYALPKL
jgi:hypothetical protein